MVASTITAAEIDGLIKDWVATSPENSLRNPENDKAWDEPLVGFASGDDPYWDTFKERVGPYCWTPAEAFVLAFPGAAAPPAGLTVISWILPQTQAAKRDSRKETAYPPERWARARAFGEVTNEKLRAHVVEELGKRGVRAMAPSLQPGWSRMPSDRWIYASTWSERHAAFVAGLGTFGLCDGLITPKGKAMRTGSVVAELSVPPTPRPYTDHREYCLWFSQGTCKKCVDRCPVGAVTEKGHQKYLCMIHVHETCKRYVKEKYRFEGYACGLCQTGVPCESGIPKRAGGK